MVSERFTYVITAAADYLPMAIREMRSLDPQARQTMRASEEIAIVESALDVEEMYPAMQRREPVFVRHIFPAQGKLALTGEQSDLHLIAAEALRLVSHETLPSGSRFSVQARILVGPGKERPYSAYAIKEAIAPLASQQTGAMEDVRSPEVVISVLALPSAGFVGISPVEFNLSDWAGGERRFSREEGQLSRSEFKLLEAFEVFKVSLPEEGDALDLGAAPGGWTRVLRNAGLAVTAVDPALLDERLLRDSGVTAVREHAQDWIRTAQRTGRTFDVVVNDMRIDARDAARFMREVLPLLRPDAFVITTLKLPQPGIPGMDPVGILQEALTELRRHYAIVRARQLFHNRNEVTVYLRVAPASMQAKKF